MTNFGRAPLSLSLHHIPASAGASGTGQQQAAPAAGSFSLERHGDDSDSSSALSSPMSISSISDVPLRSQNNGKRRLSFEEPKARKRLRFASPNSGVETARIDLDDCLTELQQTLPAKFAAQFERLMNSNTAASDDWTLPAHHRFMAALCQSVQECIDGFLLPQGIHTLDPRHVDALFQHALRAVGKLAVKSGEQAPLNRFLADPEHAAYREMVEDPQQFDMRTAETEAAFASATDKIRRLVPGYSEDASEMWKHCVDPQTIALLKRKNIDADDPLVGRFVFEGEQYFLHNMARGWDFIANAALQGRKPDLRLLDEINAVCTGRPAAAGNIQLEAGGTAFGLLLGHTASPEGLKKLEETTASLQAQGLDVKLLESGKYPGTDLDYYELHTQVNNEHDAGLLRDWAQKCIDEHQARAKDLEGDELALHDLELVIKLNQAHVFLDGNIRTCHLLLNFLRLSRGEKPFMFAEPNVMDAHTTEELLQKMKVALDRRVELPAHPVKTPVQAALLGQVKQREDQGPRKPRRNIPKSREYLAFREYLLRVRGAIFSPAAFEDFTQFSRKRGHSLQELKQSPAAFFENRRAYLAKYRYDKYGVVTEKTTLMTHVSGYLFPELDVSEIFDTLVKEGKTNETARANLRKPLWDLQEYLHGCADGPKNVKALLEMEPAAGSLPPDQMRAQFNIIYDRFRDYMRKEGRGVPPLQLSLKHKLASVFFPLEKSAAEEALLKEFRQFLETEEQSNAGNAYVPALDLLKSKKDGVWIVELQGNRAAFMELYGEYQGKNSNVISSLNYLGRFLFPEAKAMEILDELMNAELSGKKKRGNYLSVMWRLESALRAEGIEGLEGLQALAPEEGIAHIRTYMAKNRKSMGGLDVDVLEKGIIAEIFPGHQKGGNVDQDIEALQAFIISNSQQKNATKAISGFKPLLRKLRQKLEPTGWPDRNLGEFLDFRRTTLLAINRSVNPIRAPGYSFFNVMTYAAQQRYPALREFLSKNTLSSNAGGKNVAAAGMLAFFTYLREARRERGLNVDGFLSDINFESVEAFLDNKTYVLPKSSLFSEDKFREVILSFPEFLEANGMADLERSFLP